MRSWSQAALGIARLIWCPGSHKPKNPKLVKLWIWSSRISWCILLATELNRVKLLRIKVTQAAGCRWYTTHMTYPWWYHWDPGRVVYWFYGFGMFRGGVPSEMSLSDVMSLRGSCWVMWSMPTTYEQRSTRGWLCRRLAMCSWLQGECSWKSWNMELNI